MNAPLASRVRTPCAGCWPGPRPADRVRVGVVGQQSWTFDGQRRVVTHRIHVGAGDGGRREQRPILQRLQQGVPTAARVAARPVPQAAPFACASHWQAFRSVDRGFKPNGNQRNIRDFSFGHSCAATLRPAASVDFAECGVCPHNAGRTARVPVGRTLAVAYRAATITPGKRTSRLPARLSLRRQNFLCDHPLEDGHLAPRLQPPKAASFARSGRVQDTACQKRASCPVPEKF